MAGGGGGELTAEEVLLGAAGVEAPAQALTYRLRIARGRMSLQDWVRSAGWVRPVVKANENAPLFWGSGSQLSCTSR